MIDVPKITCQDRLLRRSPLVEPQMPEELVEVPGLSIQDVVLGRLTTFLWLVLVLFGFTAVACGRSLGRMTAVASASFILLVMIPFVRISAVAGARLVHMMYLVTELMAVLTLLVTYLLTECVAVLMCTAGFAGDRHAAVRSGTNSSSLAALVMPGSHWSTRPVTSTSGTSAVARPPGSCHLARSSGGFARAGVVR